MEKNEKIEERKKWNAPFLRAFDYLAKEKKCNKGKLAEMLNSNGSLISSYRSGVKRVSDDMMDRLARAYGGRLNPRFLRGESQYMLLENVPDDEIIENSARDFNPDYEIMKKQKPANDHSLNDSFLIEKAVEIAVEKATAYANELIENLKMQLHDKDQELASRNMNIRLLQQRLAELQARYDLLHIEERPFPTGVAEDNVQPKPNV